MHHHNALLGRLLQWLVLPAGVAGRTAAVVAASAASAAGVAAPLRRCSAACAAPLPLLLGCSAALLCWEVLVKRQVFGRLQGAGRLHRYPHADASSHTPAEVFDQTRET